MFPSLLIYFPSPFPLLDCACTPTTEAFQSFPESVFTRRAAAQLTREAVKQTVWISSFPGSGCSYLGSAALQCVPLYYHRLQEYIFDVHPVRSLSVRTDVPSNSISSAVIWLYLGNNCSQACANETCQSRGTRARDWGPDQSVRGIIPDRWTTSESGSLCTNWTLNRSQERRLVSFARRGITLNEGSCIKKYSRVCWSKPVTWFLLCNCIIESP